MFNVGGNRLDLNSRNLLYADEATLANFDDVGFKEFTVVDSFVELVEEFVNASSLFDKSDIFIRSEDKFVYGDVFIFLVPKARNERRAVESNALKATAAFVERRFTVANVLVVVRFLFEFDSNSSLLLNDIESVSFVVKIAFVFNSLFLTSTSICLDDEFVLKRFGSCVHSLSALNLSSHFLCMATKQSRH